MGAIEDSLRILLRSSEELKASLEATVIPDFDVATTNSSLDPSQESRNARVLAVVCHKDDWSLTEEGSVFVCKYEKSSPGLQGELEIQSIFPIYGNFNMVMSQMQRGTLNLTQPGLKSVLNHPKTGFSLTINPGEGLTGDTHAPTFYTQDVQALKSLVAECKRIREVSEIDVGSVNVAKTTHYFNWLRRYLPQRMTSEIYANFASQDLRITHQPLLERLSPASAGSPGDDIGDIRLIRDEWLQFHSRELSREGKRRLRLRIGTFNVNGKSPSQDLSSWTQAQTLEPVVTKDTEPPAIPHLKHVSPLSLGDIVSKPFEWFSRTKSSSSARSADVAVPQYLAEPVDLDPGPDMLVLGFQELDLSTEALLYSTSTAKEDAWCLAIFASLGEKAVQYEKLASKQLVGMLLVIVVKKSLKDCFGDIKTASAGAGIMGGNKGGTAIRLTFTPRAPTSDSPEPTTSPGHITLTFVNSHLAAFDEMVEKRNADYHDLCKRLFFESWDPLLEHDMQDFEDRSEGVMGQLPWTIFDTDALFWLGDLNYRIDLPDTEVRRIVGNENWEGRLATLLRYDQLHKAMRAKKIFQSFREHSIAFAPTYRFSPGLMMDKLGYDMKRKPAWTDRILHLAGRTCLVEQLSYTSHPQINLSDHRPVAADFRLDMDLINEEQLKSNILKLYSEVDMLEDTHERPIIQLDESFVDLGKVFYQKNITQTINVRNTGKIPCAFRFVPVQPESPIHPDWLHVEPTTALILPNQAVQITISVYINNALATTMNMRPRDLSGTLILHVVMGKDHFISVSGEYQYTCFANKLSTLTRLPGPVRSLGSSNDLRPEENPINAPREIMRLVNWLMTTGGHTDGLFVKPAEEKTLEVIRECLDTGDDFPFPPDTSNADISCAFGGALLRLLDSLVEPVIPASLHARCIQMTNRDEAFEVLDALSPASINVIISVTAFLHYICQGESKHDPEQIATIFAPVLLRDDASFAVTPIPNIDKRNFLLFFIK